MVLSGILAPHGANNFFVTTFVPIVFVAFIIPNRVVFEKVNHNSWIGNTPSSFLVLSYIHLLYFELIMQFLHFQSTPCWILSASQGFQRNCGWNYWLIWLVNVLHLPYHQSTGNKKSQYTRGSVFKFAQYAPGACSQIFNRLNIVEHFAGWKFCSREWSIPMKLLVHTEELCFRSVSLEHAPSQEQNP